MTRLLLRNLLHYWRTNAAVVAGVATAVAVLAGALLVGQSVRASLRDLLAERLGATDYVVSADRFFREELARGFATSDAAGDGSVSCPIIALQGVLLREGSARQDYDVNVYGVDERFWRFHGTTPPPAFGDRASIVGAPLAAHLGVQPGDGLLLRIGSGQDIPGESLYGRREGTTRTIRLTCGGIAGPERLGEFALRSGQNSVFSVFVPLMRLQRELAQPDRANTVLIAASSKEDESPKLRRLLLEHIVATDLVIRCRSLELVSKPVAQAFRPALAGLKPRPTSVLKPLVASGEGVAVESTRILLDDAIARAAFDAAGET